MSVAAKVPVRKFDAIVVGAGGAGMRASLQLAEAGLSVAVLSKVFPTRSHTVAAQGGIGASLGNMSEDNWLWHMYDTIKGSDWLGDQDAIEYMCKMAPQVVYELEHFGMPFDRNADGTIYQRPFGGHSANFGEKAVQRACAAADRTGHALLHTLYQRNVRARTQFFVEWMALDLDPRRRRRRAGRRRAARWRPSEVVDPAGEGDDVRDRRRGRIFAASTNAFINTGDGLGMAARAGIPLEDMEFWQFHPTGVAGAGVLITEGVRGEGGILLNCQRRALHGALRAEPQGPGVARRREPRRWTRRSRKGRGCGPHKDYVLLKLDHLGPEVITKRLPSIREIALKFANVDCIKEPIPVVPTIHYQMGGIPVNIHGQVVAPKNGDSNVRSSRPVRGRRMRVRVGARRQPARHQFAARPASCSAARRQFHRRQNLEGRCAQAAAPRCRRPVALRASRGSTARRPANRCRRSRSDLRKAMQAHCGVFRNQELLREGVRKVMELERARGAHGDQGQEQDVQHRARRGARARQPDRDGARRPIVSAGGAARVARRPGAQRLPEPRRRRTG